MLSTQNLEDQNLRNPEAWIKDRREKFERREALLEEYEKRFSRRKIDVDPEVDSIGFFSRLIGFKYFSIDKEIDILERCLKEDKPWQEFPDIVKAYKTRHARYEELVQSEVRF